jgi:hypothetical protein
MQMEPLSEDTLSALDIVDQSHGRVETYQVSHFVHLIVKVMIFYIGFHDIGRRKMHYERLRDGSLV